ncbi:MAG: PAS domain S-box protein, partial [Acidobacteriota bacterium]|nr:PAS domain S-box protein [Acidobacteriota bacterium]
MTAPRSDNAFSNATLRSLVDLMPHGTAVTSFPDGIVRYINRRFTLETGYTTEAIVGKTSLQMLWINQSDRKRLLEQMVESGSIRHFQASIRCANGETRIFDICSEWMEVEGQRWIISTSFDVSESRETLDSLHRAAERYRTFVQQSREGIVRYEFDEPIQTDIPVDEQVTRLLRSGRVAECNDAFARIYSYPSAADMVGTSVESVMRSGTDQPANQVKAFVKNGYRDDAFELELTSGSGEPLWYTGTSLGITEGGMLTRVWSTRQDVTGRRRAELALDRREAFFKMVIDNVRDLITVVDDQMCVQYISSSVEAALGYDMIDSLGHSIAEYIHPDDLPVASKKLAQLLDVPDRSDVLVARLRTNDGNWRHFETVGSSHRDSEGRVAVSLCSRDITDKQQLEERLRQAQKLEAIGHLAGGVAHDFNNLLTVIAGFADVIERQESMTESVREAVTEIRHANDRGADLTQQLLAFARKQVLQAKPVTLESVVLDMEGLLRRLIGDHIVLKTELSTTPLVFLADRGQLEQVLMNLALNARDAMIGGGSIFVKTGGVTIDDTRHTRLTVTDDGCGMDEATRRRVFEPFFSTKASGKGSGLGLATVYGIVEQSGGSIAVESTLGSGTSVTVNFPLNALPGDDAYPDYVVTATSQDDGGVERILIAEDDAAIRRVICQALEQP